MQTGSSNDPLIEIGPGLSVPKSRLPRALWPGLSDDVLAALNSVDADELLRQYRTHFHPPPYQLDWSGAEVAEHRRRIAEWEKRVGPEVVRRTQIQSLVILGLFLLVAFGLPLVAQLTAK
jgi:hypothetical protein